MGGRLNSGWETRKGEWEAGKPTRSGRQKKKKNSRKPGGCKRVGSQEEVGYRRGRVTGGPKVGEAGREWDGSRGWEVEEDREAKKK